MVSKRRLTEYAESSHFKKFLYIDFGTRDNHGKTPLMKTYINGHDEVVQQLDELFNQYLRNRIRCCQPSIKTLIFLVKKRPKFMNSLIRKQKLLHWLTGNVGEGDAGDDGGLSEHWSKLIKVCACTYFTIF